MFRIRCYQMKLRRALNDAAWVLAETSASRLGRGHGGFDKACKFELRHLEQIGSDLEPVALGERGKLVAHGRKIFRRLVGFLKRHGNDSPIHGQNNIDLREEIPKWQMT